MNAKPNAKVVLLQAIQQGATTRAALAITMKKNQSQISKLAKGCRKLGLIREHGHPRKLKLTELGFGLIHNYSNIPLGAKSEKVSEKVKPVSFHNFQVKFPIVKDGSEGKIQWVPIKNTKFKQIKTETIPQVNITHTGKNVVVSLCNAAMLELGTGIKRKVIDMEIAVVHVAQQFLSENGLEIDVMRGETISQNIATSAEEVKERLDRNVHDAVYLGRLASSAYRMSKPAKAWIDWSPRAFPHLETNDLPYAHKFEMMPEWLAEMYKDRLNMQEYNKNLKLHTKIQQEQLKTQRKMQALLAHKDAQPFRSKEPASGVS